MCNTLYTYTYITLILYKAHMHAQNSPKTNFNQHSSKTIPRAYSNCMSQDVTEKMVTVGDNSEPPDDV